MLAAVRIASPPKLRPEKIVSLKTFACGYQLGSNRRPVVASFGARRHARPMPSVLRRRLKLVRDGGHPKLATLTRVIQVGQVKAQEALADVRCRAYCGLKSDIVRGPKSATRRHSACKYPTSVLTGKSACPLSRPNGEPSATEKD
jgi:hypothetical protein